MFPELLQGEPEAPKRRATDQAGETVDVDAQARERRARRRDEAQAEIPIDQMTPEQAKAEVERLRRDRVLDEKIPTMANALAFDRNYVEGNPVASLDVRGLKAANKHGQAVGTEFLVHVGNTLDGIAKKTGAFAAHESGDEFKLTHADEGLLKSTIERANAKLAETPFEFFDKDGNPKKLVGELHHGTAKNPEAADREMAAAKVRRAQEEAARTGPVAPPGEGDAVNRGGGGGVPEPVPAKAEAKPAEEVTPRQAVHSKVNEVIPGEEGKAVRAALYRSGEVTPESKPEDVIAAAVTSPEFVNPERGAVKVNIPASADGTSLIAKVADRIGNAVKGLGSESAKAARNIRNGAVLELAKGFDKLKMIQHPFRKGEGIPEVAKSIITMSEAPKPLKDSDGKNRDMGIGGDDGLGRKFGQHVRTPSFMFKRMFENGAGYNVDAEIAANDATFKRKAYTDWFKDWTKRHNVKDDSIKIDQIMGPVQEKIRDLAYELAPMDKERRRLQSDILRFRKTAVRQTTDAAEREAINKALTRGESGDRSGKAKLTEGQLRKAMDDAEGHELVKRATDALAEFDRVNQKRFSELLENRTKLYAEANEKIKALAAKSQEARIALLVEDEVKRPTWLNDMVTESDVKAADELRDFTGSFKEPGKEVGLRMRDESYITHLFKKGDVAAKDMAGTGEGIARDVLNFHRRQPNSVNLMPSVHAAMEYYIPAITRKLALQPLLNKWYANGKNLYADPTSEYYAPKFGKWLQNEINAIEHPRKLDIIEKGTDLVKQAEITKLLAFNQKVGIKHVVGKITNLAGYHHLYLLPAMGNQVAIMARKAENLPLVGKAFEATTGRVLDIAHMSKADAKLVNDFTANLVSSRQIRNALMEDPLIAGYSQDIVNATFGPSARGWVQPVINKARWVKNAAGQPVAAAEALENGLNMLASAQRGKAAGLTPEQNVRGIITNLLAYSQRGGHDASAFVKSSVGRAGTALTQTPSKMMELYADIAKRGLAGEKDIYGEDGTANLVRAVMAIGIVGYLGDKAGHNLWQMLLHPPLINVEWAKDAGTYIGHTVATHSGFSTDKKTKTEHERKAFEAQARMQGSMMGAIATTPAASILKDMYQVVNSPVGFAKSIPAVQQVRAELGKTPQGYKDAAHFMTTSPTPERKKFLKGLSTLKGVQEIKKGMKKSAK